MKKIIYALITLCLLGLVQASMCGDQIELKTNCTMLTPTLTCGTYNYTIFNYTGSLVELGNLTLMNSSIYFFNFTQSKGHYIVELCDGTTREVKVEDSEINNMGNALAIILGIAFLGGMLLYIAFKVDEEHQLLKTLFVFISIFMFMLIPAFLMQYSDLELIKNLHKYYLWVIRIFVGYALVFVVWAFFKRIRF